MYTINIAKGNGRNWNDTGLQYKHHFRVEIRDSDEAKQVVSELLGFYPAPEYNVTMRKATTTSVEMWLAENMKCGTYLKHGE